MSGVFIQPAWIASTPADVTIVDVRRKSAYASGHVPGAVNVPFQRFRDPAEQTAGQLPTPDDFASLLSEAGITPEDRLLAYDDECGVYASRFLVTAEVFGHDTDRLYVLDGDFETWRREHETTTSTSATRPTDYTCRRRPDGPLIDETELETALDGPQVVVDTRDPLEYETVHVPNAVNLQWRHLVDSERHQLKPPTDIRRILEEKGIVPNVPIRLYCNTARRLSFIYAVLRELGYDDVAFYEGGIKEWAEWGGPVETTVS